MKIPTHKAKISKPVNGCFKNLIKFEYKLTSELKVPASRKAAEKELRTQLSNLINI